MILWLWWGWRGEQQVIAAIRAQSPEVSIAIGPWAPPLIRRVLPLQWHFLVQRVDSVDAWVPSNDHDLGKLAHFKQLRSLWVFGANLSDDGLVALARLGNLKHLELSCMRIRGRGLAHLWALHGLEYLALAQAEDVSEFDGRSLIHLASLRNLRELYLLNLTVRDEDLAALASLRELRVLELYVLGISDAALGHLRGLGQLRRLVLSDVDLTDRGAAHLSQLSSLQELSVVDGTFRFSEEGIAHCQRLTNLKYVVVSEPIDAPRDWVAPIRRAFPQATICLDRETSSVLRTFPPAASAPATGGSQAP
jgi:hypothetical protein